MKVTKEELISEAKYIKGNNNKLSSARKPTRMRLKALAIEEGMLLEIEERTALKRAFKAKRKKFGESTSTPELVQLAILSNIKLDDIWD